MFEDPIVTFEAGGEASFSLVGVDIRVDEDESVGVHIAAETLARDFDRVTNQESAAALKTNGALMAQDTDDVKGTSEAEDTRKATANCILIGTVSGSPIIRSLVEDGKIDVTDINGKWESWLTICVSKPFNDYENALVIVGSDKRGAIFGAYNLAEQIGVSPWYWWADVPPKLHSEIYALPVTTVNGEPDVKYRGIFINDEAPGMDTWFAERYGPENTFDLRVYKHVFELLLRLKANFLWPAMWRGFPEPGRSFFVDDPENQKVANDYGIVVGTSHHEPMQRAMNEWSTNQPEGTWNWENNKDKVTEYFDFGAERAVPYESYITMGMRAEGDGPISGDDPVATLTEILRVQRDIIKDKYGSEDGEMQIMALYKEVQVHYENGLKIPDDMTLLFADDNFGSIRRYPTEGERKRKGGVGVYHHFQYTGAPRSYRWQNSNSLAKSLYQLQLAYSKGASQIWIFNVGDLKPQELPMSFAFDMAWNVESIRREGFVDYFQALANREFGDTYASRIADLWYGFERLIALRKQEHIEPQTFSILKYREAEKIIDRWGALSTEAEAIYAEVSESQKPAFFELVVHPIKSTYIYNLLRITQTKNQLYGRQRRNTANGLLHECLRLFDEDDKITREYHSLLDGKWNHMLRQPHYGFGGHALGPYRDMIDGLTWVRTNVDSNPSIGQMVIAVEGHEGVDPGIINEDSDRTHPSRKWLEPGLTLEPMSPYGPQDRYFEIFHAGTRTFNWVAKPQHSWIKLSEYEGTMKPDDDDIRIFVTIDWKEVPADFDEKTVIEVTGSVNKSYELVRLVVQNRKAPDDFKGFVEVDTYVSIHPGNWASEPYIVHPALGRQDPGSVTLPNEYDVSDPDDIPFLKYDIYTFTDRDDVNLEIHFNMTLETDPESKMSYDIRFDDGDIKTHRLTTDSGELPQGWSQAVQDCVWKKRHGLGPVSAGNHSVEIRFRQLNIAMEKVVVDLGGTDMKYLGPPESDYLDPEKKIGNGFQVTHQEVGELGNDVGGGDDIRIALHM